jgi:hemoglobin
LVLLPLTAPRDTPAQENGAQGSKNPELDRQIFGLLRSVINAGADLYNPPQNDRAGCYRLYHGSLLTLRPLLAHHPELQKAIDAGLAEADRAQDVPTRAFALRRVLDTIFEKLRPTAVARRTGEKKSTTTEDPRKETARTETAEKKSTTTEIPRKDTARTETAEKRSTTTDLPRKDTARTEPGKLPAVPQNLWQRLGGESEVRKLVDEWVNRAGPDLKVNFTRGKPKPSDQELADLKAKLVAFISQASDGPVVYKGKSMKEAHKGMAISDSQFDAFIADLKKAMAARGMKDAEIQDLVKRIESTRQDVVEPAKAEEKKSTPPKPEPKTEEKKSTPAQVEPKQEEKKSTPPKPEPKKEEKKPTPLDPDAKKTEKT